MNKPEIIIIHHIPGRLRIRFSLPPKDIELMKKKIGNHPGISSMEYNPISRSTLFYYNPAAVKWEEIVIRAAIYLSVEYSMKPVILHEKGKNTPLKDIDNFALLTIGFGWLTKLYNTAMNTQNTRNVVDYFVGGTVLTSVLSHGKREYEKTGHMDPEVLSAFYLLNTFIQGNILQSATITWFMTFGRHLFEGEKVELQAYKIFDSKDSKTYYDVVVRNKGSSNKNNMLKIVIDSVQSTVLKSKNSTFLNSVKLINKNHNNILEGFAGSKEMVFLRIES